MKQDAGVGFAAKGFLPRSYGSIQFTHPGTCHVDQIIERSSDMDRGFHRFGRGKNPLEPVDIGARSEANVDDDAQHTTKQLMIQPNGVPLDDPNRLKSANTFSGRARA